MQFIFRKIRLIIFLSLLSVGYSIAQNPPGDPGGGPGGDPGGDPDAVPITGIELLLGAGALLGAKRLNSIRKNIK